VERELGRGAMGVIYKADDPDIGRTVAIKLVRADLLDGEDREQFLARFRHEARAAGRCAHPNIVALYDFAMHDGNPFLAMEYVDGVGLGQALKRVGRFAPADAVAIILQVLAALGAAHALGVVHRDVKPANIMLLPNGQVKVTDFGISRLDTSHLTQDGAIIGTPAYMSPEQCRGDDVDARSDLFSVGSVLYELLSGARAFSGRNVTEVTYQLLTAESRDLTELASDVPAGLAAVLRQAMAKTKEARYASAQAMADALRAAMRAGDSRSPGEIAASEQTVVMPSRATAEPVPSATVDDATLNTIEHRLARYVGPIARHLVRDAARRTASIEALCETVSRNIGQTADRERFIAEAVTGSVHQTGITSVRPPPTVGGGTPTGINISAVQAERVERALIRALGPIAKLLVKRALPGAASEAALWEQLATHIERPADREAFLRQRSAG
jgi:serine/threonine protein kinase